MTSGVNVTSGPSAYSRQRDLDVGHVVIMYRRRGIDFANRVFHRLCRVRNLMRWEQIVLASKIETAIKEQTND